MGEALRCDIDVAEVDALEDGLTEVVTGEPALLATNSSRKLGPQQEAVEDDAAYVPKKTAADELRRLVEDRRYYRCPQRVLENASVEAAVAEMSISARKFNFAELTSDVTRLAISRSPNC